METINDYMYTVEQAAEFLKKLDTFMHAAYSKKDPMQVHMDMVFAPAEKQYLLKVLSTAPLTATESQHLQNTLESLSQYIQKIPVCSIITAYNLSVEQSDRIRDWFRFTFDKPFLISLSVNQKLIGGAVIEFQGKYKNYSLQKLIEEKYMVESL